MAKQAKRHPFKIIFYVTILITTNVFSQFKYGSEIANQIKLPKSPEAEAFEKYGNTPIDLYTGSLNISLPLQTLEGRELEIPMSLTYDASGIKVIQVATNVGLGWNLNVGGRISRIANGRPDDVGYNSGPYDGLSSQYYNVLLNGDWSSSQEFINYHELRKSMADGCTDLLIDIYSLNVMGISDYIVIDRYTQQAFTLINRKLKVQGGVSPNQWVVTDQTGNQYFFGQNNKVETAVLPGIDDGGDPPNPCSTSNYNTTTSWVLTKIISKNGLDVFTFDYDFYEWVNPMPGMTVSSATNLLQASNPQGQIFQYHWGPIGNNYSYSGEYKTTQQMIKGIRYNDRLVADFVYKTRTDMMFTTPNNGGALDFIRLYKFNYDDSAGPSNYLEPVYKKITFNHDYFGSPTGNTFFRRLKLNDILVAEGPNFNNNNSKSYAFDYYEDYQIPPIDSKSQDYLGLYNGRPNLTLIPTMTSPDGILAAGNRNFYLNYALTGTIRKITYPTKGYTEFSFEQHEVKPSDAYPTTDVDNRFSGNGGIYNLNNVHPLMLDANVTGGQTGLMTIIQEDDYNIDCEGNGLYLIHKPNCTDYADPTVTNQNRGSLHISESSIVPSCHGVETIPIQNVWTQMSSLNPPFSIAGSIMYGSTVSHQIIHLKPGVYQVTVWRKEGNGSPIGGGTPAPPTHVTIWHNVQSWPLNSSAQGFRIKSVKDYTREYILSTEKEYKYLDDISSPISSGKEIAFIPMPVYYATGQDATFVGHLIRTTAGIEYSPNVVYGTVYEIEKHGSLINGYTQHNFNLDYQPSGLVSNAGVKSYKCKFNFGKEYSTKYFDSSTNLICVENFTYETTGLGFYEGGVSAINDYRYGGKLTHWYKYPNDETYTHSYDVDPFVIPDLGGAQPQLPQGMAVPCAASLLSLPCIPGTEYNYDGRIGAYAQLLMASDYRFGSTNITRKTKTTFTDQANGSSYRGITETEVYKYDSDNLLIEKQVATQPNAFSQLNINNLINGIKTTYAYDLSSDANPDKISDIWVYNVQNGISTLLSHRNNTFADFGIRNSRTANHIRMVKEAKGNNPLETRLLFDYNDADPAIGDGNIREAIEISGASDEKHESYIFGYNDQFPVAKLSGIAFNSINPQSIENIKNLSNQPINDLNTAALLTALNDLRINYPDSQITTYTYDPVKGITSETDPKGISIFYEYDQLGRLKTVKDLDGNILSENEYHYRTQN